MSEPKELVNELESYFLCQHRAYCEALDREIKRANRTDLKDVQGKWYKYCVDGKLSAKRYRVIKAKEPIVSDATNTQEQPASTGTGQDRMNPDNSQAQPGAFSRSVDWAAEKIKNNRGLIGMAVGVGLAYAGQVGYSRYQQNRENMRRVSAPTATDGNTPGGMAS